MSNPMTKEYLSNEIAQLLADVMGMEKEEITPDQELVNDLGAESLDFVEFNADLEKRFNITLPKKTSLQIAGKITGNPERFYHPDSGLTAEGVELLENSLSQYQHLKPGMTTFDIFSASRLENIVSLCFNLFEQYAPSQCSDCGASTFTLSPKGKLACDSCHSIVKTINGTEAEEAALRKYLTLELDQAV